MKSGEFRVKPTIKDIADKAGVSIATVSRVLASKGDSYSKKTGRKVLKIAKEMGYRKNNTAVELVKKKGNVIAVIINATPTNFSTQIIDGIQKQANSLGQHVIILYAGNRSPELQHQAILTALERAISGILLVAIEPDQEDMKLLEGAGTPFCFVSLYLEQNNILAVSSNNRDVAYQATNYLIGHGHKKIGLAGIDQYHTGSQRIDGYRLAMKEHQLNVKDDWIKLGDYSYDSGLKLLGDFLSTRVTGIVAASDMVAAGLLNAAQQKGIQLPDQLSIISIDGTVICQIATPALTSVTQDFYTIGVESVNKVMGKKAPLFIPTHITKRSSVAEI